MPPKPTISTPIVLASTSPYRKEILNKLKLPFITDSPNTDETPRKDEEPEQLARRLAAEKAISLKSKYPHHLIIGSDQVATLESGAILTKPLTHEIATQQLKASSGSTVHFHTGLSLFNTATETQTTIVEPFEVTFRSLTDDEIENYLNIEKPYNCAGSFMVEGLGICLFKKLKGDDFNALIGLPLIRLLDLLDIEGVSPIKTRKR